jgi:hypothetical protein
LDLARLKDEGLIHKGSTDGAVSADGRLLYLRHSESSSNGFECLRIGRANDAAGKPELEPIHEEDRSSNPYVADPHRKLIAEGSGVFSADLKRKVGELDFRVLSFFPERPILAGIVDASVLKTASYNSFRPTAEVRLPADFISKAYPARRQKYPYCIRRVRDRDVYHYQIRLFPDGPRNRFVAAYGDRAAVVPLADLKLDGEPLLWVTVRAPDVIHVAKPAVIELKRSNPKVAIALKKAPAGAKLGDSGITWTPRADQIGAAQFELELSHGASRASQYFNVDVVRPSVRLPFTAKRLAVGNDGQHAVAWTSLGPFDEPSGDEAGIAPPTRLATIRVADLTVVKTASLPVRVSDVTLAENRVFAAVSTRAQLITLGLEDLKERNVQRTGQPLGQLKIGADKFLFSSDSQGRLRQFRLKDLVEVNAAPETAKEPGGDGFPPEIFDFGVSLAPDNEVGRLQEAFPELRRLRDGWWVKGLVYDKSFSKVRMVTYLPGAIGPQESRLPFDEDRSAGRDRQSLSLARVGPENIWQLEDRGDLVFAHIAERVERRDGGDFQSHDDADTQRFRYLRIEYRPSTSDELKVEAVLARMPEHRIESDRVEMVVVGRRAVVLFDRDVYFHDFSPPADKQIFPLRFVPDQTVMILADEKPVTLKHRLAGGAAPYRYQLLTTEDAFTFDSKSGDLKVDSARLRRTAADRAIMFGQGDEASKKSLKEYLARVTKPFETAFGRKPSGIPTVVTIELKGKDAEGQTATLAYQLVVELTKADVAGAYEKVRNRLR